MITTGTTQLPVMKGRAADGDYAEGQPVILSRAAFSI